VKPAGDSKEPAETGLGEREATRKKGKAGKATEGNHKRMVLGLPGWGTLGRQNEGGAGERKRNRKRNQREGEIMEGRGRGKGKTGRKKKEGAESGEKISVYKEEGGEGSIPLYRWEQG